MPGGYTKPMSYSAPETPSAQRPERPTARPSERVQIFALPTRTMYGSLRFSWLSYLGLAEQQHAAQLPTSTAAVSYLSTQALMRAMAAARLDVPSSAASEIEVDRSCTLCTSGKKHGKPRIAGVNFNMSQVNPLVVGAFSRNASAVLGVDVETLDARLFSGFARLALSNEERAFYERVAQERPAPVLHLLSVALWTAKEAVLKATGHGLSVVPSLVRVQLTDDLLDALELAMNEEVPGDLLDSDIPEPTALRVLTQDRLAAHATFSAPHGYPWHYPTRRTPSTHRRCSSPWRWRPRPGVSPRRLRLSFCRWLLPWSSSACSPISHAQSPNNPYND